MSDLFVDPHGLLEHVHPDLVKVIEAAEQSPQAFQVVYGIRTEAAEQKAIEEGHSQTSHSRHLPQADEHGLSCAVDIGVFVNGKYIGNGPEVPALYTAVSKQILAAATRLGIPLEWGGAAIGAWAPGVVSHFRDWGHYQLPWKEYP